MSASMSSSATLPVAQRDIRSASKLTKRDKDHGAKWSHGQRPSSGVHMRWTGADTELVGGSESQRAKSRPEKHHAHAMYETKSRANVTPKHSPSHTYDLGRSGGRVARSADAHFDARDGPASRSLVYLDLVPKNIHGDSSVHVVDAETLYSYDHTGPSPDEYGRKVGLEGLVEKAEKRWVSEQTEKMVRGEYEILDGEGETTTLKKGKTSPKQKAVKHQPSTVKDLEEDDGFELV